MAAVMHRLSREYVFWPVITTDDISNAAAEVAILEAGVMPQEVDWVPADIVESLGTFSIRALVSGPGQGGDIELPVGDYQSWIRITDLVERPVRMPGVVTIS